MNQAPIFKRRISLDERPRFFNVLTGQVSIVGPRAHAASHNEEYRQNGADLKGKTRIKSGQSWRP